MLTLPWLLGIKPNGDLLLSSRRCIYRPFNYVLLLMAPFLPAFLNNRKVCLLYCNLNEKRIWIKILDNTECLTVTTFIQVFGVNLDCVVNESGSEMPINSNREQKEMWIWTSAVFAHVQAWFCSSNQFTWAPNESKHRNTLKKEDFV